ncbi:hypothetical protein [Gemmobacter sp. 24YEA27]|uniref:hypothetical protein n=1 Tax=Gemmobacter sp. 24YEA27 TaxID=3040672 RepID=UPI0024B3C30C|nr:hypothetical protein [Gemmobacter sp. 24YEA27]
MAVWPPISSIAARDGLFDPVFGSGKALSGAQDLPGNRRVVIGSSSLALMGIQDHEIQQIPRNAHIKRSQESGPGFRETWAITSSPLLRVAIACSRPPRQAP